jgi:hypothetical protein
MSFKDDLEKRRQSTAEARAKDEALRRKRLETRTTQAEKLESFLRSENPAPLGLTLSRTDARVTLTHQEFSVVIDADLEGYAAFVTANKTGSAFPIPEKVSGTKRLSSVEAVKDYILDVFED